MTAIAVAAICPTQLVTASMTRSFHTLTSSKIPISAFREYQRMMILMIRERRQPGFLDSNA